MLIATVGASLFCVTISAASYNPEASPGTDSWRRRMGNLQAIAFLVVATILEVSGDAVIRIALRDHEGVSALRFVLFVLGAVLVFGYGTFLNLAPLEFDEVVGLYIATLFIVWQIINFVFFRTLPTPQILAGGSLIVIGGALVSFWKA